MRFAVAICAGLLAGASVASAQDDAGTATAATFLEYCTSSVPDRVTTCEMVLFGIVVMHQVDQEAGHAQRLFCVPPDLKPPDVRAAVVRQLTGQATLLEQQYVGSTVVALARSFPCRR